jgi:hypothetical protein
MNLIEAMTAAETDAIFYRFMKEKVKMEDNQMLVDFRDELRIKEKEKETAQEQGKQNDL